MEKEVFLRSENFFFNIFRVLPKFSPHSSRPLSKEGNFRKWLWNEEFNIEQLSHNAGALVTKGIFVHRDCFAKKNYYNVRETCNFNIQRSLFCVISKGQQLDKVVRVAGKLSYMHNTEYLEISWAYRALCILGSLHKKGNRNWCIKSFTGIRPQLGRKILPIRPHWQKGRRLPTAAVDDVVTILTLHRKICE